MQIQEVTTFKNTLFSSKYEYFTLYTLSYKCTIEGNYHEFIKLFKIESWLFFKAKRSWVQIPARYSGWPSHYNNVGCSARLEIRFELNLLPRVNKVTLLYALNVFLELPHLHTQLSTYTASTEQI